MARPLRIEYPGASYHLTARGNARAPIFLNDDDRRQFLAVLADVISKYRWLCYGYCLMGNHYHLLIETPEANLSVGMRQLGGIYTQKFNREHGRVGHLFQGRYKSVLVEKESYLLELCRYIVLNPVRAGLVDHPAQYGWSSYQAIAGHAQPPSWLQIEWVLGQFAENLDVARQQYQEFVLAGIRKGSPWQELKNQCFLGGDSFLDHLAPYLDDRQSEREIPRIQRLAGRPSLPDLLSRNLSKQERNEAIFAAHVTHGFSQQEIASHCNLHYSTVSRIVQREAKKSKRKT